LVAYMTMSNLTKSSTNAYIDGTNTFYAAESGLNRRAEQLRQKFFGYALPGNTTATPNPSNIATCFPLSLTTTPTANNDFECRNYPFKYNNNIAQTTSTDGSGATVLSEQDGGKNSIQYTSFTFVQDKTSYVAGSSPPAPTPTRIPAGQTYAGLNALEYRYTVYATAAKPDLTNPTNPVQNSDSKTVLQMDFRSRVVPLFQFAVFYDGDLEMSSTPKMILGGRVHTNGNLYAQTTSTSAGSPPTGATTYFNDQVTSAGDIYNRTDASIPYQGSNASFAPVRVLQSGDPITNSPAPVYYPANYFRSSVYASNLPLSTYEIAAFGGQVKDGAAGATTLNTPEAGFLRKRNYFNNQVGRYYDKADMRLEMVPDRDVTNKATTPWTRDSSRIPFNFTSIQTGGAGTCTTALPAAGNDPAPTYIDPNRNNFATLHCNIFTKGQLQSLRQPVMVRTYIKQTAALLATENGILQPPGFVSPAPPALSVSTSNSAILRALQVALVSTPSPVNYDTLNTLFSDGVYGGNTGAVVNGSLKAFKDTFTTLIDSAHIPALTAADRTALLSASPNQIAALRGAWFLPAPVQRIENNNPVVQITENRRNSGFYDNRERRWMTMLQTNVQSLSVWNRDGLYVEATNTDLTLPYATTDPLKDAAFNTGIDSFADTVYVTAGLAFARAAATGTIGLTSLGLGSSDTTEGGLVLHATVSDDLDGDGAISAANDITPDTTAPIYRKKPDGTNVLGTSGNPITIDYPRKYPGGANGQSPFGFAFNGGDYLPGALTLVTDREVYIQGNFNNNGAAQPTATVNVPSVDRLPASVMADTITILSNECVSGVGPLNFLLTPGGQISCGIPNTSHGSTVDFGTSRYIVSNPTAVNAAFLSSVMESCNNLGFNRACVGPARYSGGLNNYYRLLEDWSTNTEYFNYYGSFVSVGRPLESSGQWIAGQGSPAGYANVPQRNFNFDTKFNSFSLLPPLSPSAIYLQQDVFKRKY
jgi:hypothetical protein